MQFAIIADDLSGACDTGVQLARSGYRTLVWLDSSQPLPQGFDAVAFDTDSRTFSADEATARVRSAVSFLGKAEILYKKVDSTLRGNIGAEIRAILETSSRKKAIVAPAFPAQGRVTRGGIQHMDDLPVHQTSLANDPLNPVTESHIPTLLTRDGLGPVGVLERSSLNHAELTEALKSHDILVADIESEDDFSNLIASIPNPDEVLWVGSAGLLRGLAQAFPGNSAKPAYRKKSQRVLTVVGSVNPVSRGQLEHLRQHIPSLEIEVDDLNPTSLQSKAQELKELLGKNLGAVLYSSLEAGDSKQIAEALARVVFKLRECLEALVLTGGDTAIHVLRRLGVLGIELEAELEPGIPLGYSVGSEKRLAIVTKAGGFGSPEALIRAYRVLSGRSHE